ncbi:TadE/TadG family type IV pilus assembly protein [Arthrobacter sp. SDTb3-6]|uniref:TadE/TadG family type IV pilus assembly protein n=1 Tax=Arthrobacter sp. SDTb3-6 TaxID=2713571 RepID=UPI00159E2069|nr:TadE family protein [Arthrobacter sp. SDTb3-6]NVM99294.1 pilus assembly protein [Arthrobacter sp. SDTb3-6]
MAVKEGSQNGAATVEFALVVPILLAIILGIIQFGYVFFMQISMTQAARAAVRSMVVENDPTSAKNIAVANVVGLSTDEVSIPASCPNPATIPATTITVTVTHTVNAIGDLLPISLVRKATMQCGG